MERSKRRYFTAIGLYIPLALLSLIILRIVLYFIGHSTPSITYYLQAIVMIGILSPLVAVWQLWGLPLLSSLSGLLFLVGVPTIIALILPEFFNFVDFAVVQDLVLPSLVGGAGAEFATKIHARRELLEEEI